MKLSGVYRSLSEHSHIHLCTNTLYIQYVYVFSTYVHYKLKCKGGKYFILKTCILTDKTNTFEDAVNRPVTVMYRKKIVCILSPVWVWPQNLINITSIVLSG